MGLNEGGADHLPPVRLSQGTTNSTAKIQEAAGQCWRSDPRDTSREKLEGQSNGLLLTKLSVQSTNRMRNQIAGGQDRGEGGTGVGAQDTAQDKIPPLVQSQWTACG